MHIIHFLHTTSLCIQLTVCTYVAHPFVSTYVHSDNAHCLDANVACKFIDFSVLLHKVTFLDAFTDSFPLAQQPIKRFYPCHVELVLISNSSHDP